MTIATGSDTVGFGYDALGRRVTRTAGGVTTRFVRAGYEYGGIVLLEKQGATVVKSYLYGAGGLIRSGSEWLGADDLGSSRTVWSGSGASVGSALYDAFGNIRDSGGTSAGSYAFAAHSGYRSDGDGGLLQVGARYYDPQVGQFLSRDTELDQKPYNYCEHDPVNSLDPSGNSPEDDNESQQGEKKPPKLPKSPIEDGKVKVPFKVNGEIEGEIKVGRGKNGKSPKVEGEVRIDLTKPFRKFERWFRKRVVNAVKKEVSH